MTPELERTLLSLDGLSLGDALGERLARSPELVAGRSLPAAPWPWTDDTAMALSVVESLASGGVDRDALVQRFAARYTREPWRGYGSGAAKLLIAVNLGRKWSDASRALFRGEGSKGNGAAMRAAPLGAFFSDDFSRVAAEATASAEVTHAHPDGQAGAIAVALAAAAAWRGEPLFEAVLDQLPDGETRDGVEAAAELPATTTLEAAVRALGNGSDVLASDTVPLALWLAARHPRDYVEAIWTTAAAGGDVDTNCAIVGGVVALSAGRAALPAAWLSAREPLPGR